MSPTEKENLIKQIFASELDYQEIKERADGLKAKSSLTTEEQAVSVDYEKKLQHDRDVIKIWIDKLKTEGIANLNTATRLQIRQKVLDELRDKELNEPKLGIAALQEKINYLNQKTILTDGEAKLKEDFGIQLKPDEIKQSDYDIYIADLNKRIAKRQNRIIILDELKLMTKTLWQQ